MTDVLLQVLEIVIIGEKKVGVFLKSLMYFCLLI